MEHKAKFELKLYPERTTQKNDYRTPILQPLERYNINSCKGPYRERAYKRKPYAPKNVHTMRPWHNPKNNIPFDLLWVPKPILREDPWKVVDRKPIETPPVDYEIIKNRPRHYMTPAISIDDIDEPSVRDLIIYDTYVSQKQHGEREMKLKFTKKEIPNSTHEKYVNPLKDNFCVFKPLPNGWKGMGKQWETKQYIQLIDPDKAYWKDYHNVLNTQVGVCPYKHYITDETRKEIRDLIDKDELRMSCDLMKPRYLGHRPRNVSGPLRKQELIAKDRAM